MDIANARVSSARRVPTGIFGLEDIMDGGIPLCGITVVLGGVGTGKTTFGPHLRDRDFLLGVLGVESAET